MDEPVKRGRKPGTPNPKPEPILPIITSYACVRGPDGLWRLVTFKSQGDQILATKVEPKNGDHRSNVIDLMISRVSMD